MLARPLVFVGNQAQPLGIADILAAGENYPATIATQNIAAVTGAMLLNTLLKRNPGGASADVLDTAANIVAAIQAAANGQQVPNGLTWRHRVINLPAFALTYTATANTGSTVVANGVVNASSVKDFLCSIPVPAALQNVALTSVNGTAVLSLPAGTLVNAYPPAGLAALQVGQVVTNAQAGQQGNTIAAINIAAGTVTMSGNSNATNAAAVNFIFSPTFTFEGIGQGLL